MRINLDLTIAEGCFGRDQSLAADTGGNTAPMFTFTARALATLIIVLLGALAVSAQSSPFTSSPNITGLNSKGGCYKISGELACRWDGDCQKVGDQCYSCTEDYTYSAGMNQCYRCTGGTSLTNSGGSWVCQ